LNRIVSAYKAFVAFIKDDPARIAMIFALIIAAALLITLTGCAANFTPAMRSEVKAVEDKLDDTIGAIADTAVAAKAEGKSDGAAAMAGIAAGKDYTLDNVAIDENGLPGWLETLLLAAGPALLAALGLNKYRNVTRTKDIAQAWEA